MKKLKLGLPGRRKTFRRMMQDEEWFTGPKDIADTLEEALERVRAIERDFGTDTRGNPKPFEYEYYIAPPYVTGKEGYIIFSRGINDFD